MKIFYHKDFDKKYAKLRTSDKKRVEERVKLFLIAPHHPLLNNHALNPTRRHVLCRSINITGDLRLIFKIIDAENDIYHFLDVDTHSNLY